VIGYLPTLLFDAASSSWILNDLNELNDRHDSHSSQASRLSPRLLQLIVLAKILAQVVFPTPLGPQKIDMPVPGVCFK